MIKIIEGYGFETDSRNYILYETGMREKRVFGSTEKKTGEIVEFKDLLGFYSNLETMCNALLEIETKKSANNARVKEIGDYLEIMRNISQQIKDAIDNTAF